MAPTLGDCLTMLTGSPTRYCCYRLHQIQLIGGSFSTGLMFSGRLQLRRNKVPTGTLVVKQGRLNGTIISADTLSNLIVLQLARLV